MNMKTVGGESSGQSGMDEFNRLTVNILNDLYETFPHYALVKTDAYYENVDDREFIDKLGQPELFGEEPS